MANLFDLTGRTAVVVGGTTGIGRALALGLADAGADVVATGRRPHAVEEVAAAIEARGRRTLRHPADVGDSAALRRLRDACLASFGRVDIVVAAAGITKRVATLEMSEQDWNAILDTNLTSVFLGCRASIPLMRRGGGGAIVNVGSITGIRGTENMVAYSASKSGVTALTASLALDHAADNIRVNAIAPAAIRTRMVEGMLEEAPDRALATQRLLSKHPIGRVGTPEEAAGVIAFLASADAGFMTGLTIPVDGGRSIR